MDPQAVLTDPKTLTLIERVCRRRFRDPNHADQCYLFVLKGLQAHGGRRLRAFQGKSRLTTFLYTVVNALAMDFHRKIHGRRRLPAVVKQMPAWAQAVYRWVCWERHSYDDAYELLMVHSLYEKRYETYCRSLDEIRQAPCAQNPSFASLDAMAHGSPDGIAEPERNPLDALLDSLDRHHRRTAIRVIRDQAAQLSQADRLLIDLVYGNGQTIAAAARVLGISRPGARKRLDRILLNLKKELLAQGIRHG